MNESIVTDFVRCHKLDIFQCQHSAHDSGISFLNLSQGFIPACSNKIAVMDPGKLIEFGLRTELVEKQGAYYDLCKVQKSIYKF